MRPLLIALPFALLSSFAAAAEHNHEHGHDHDHAHHDEHGSLGAHEHGAAELDAALDGSTLEIELRTPAMNLVGFEHMPSSDADKKAVADAQRQLQQPDTLFGVPASAGCSLTKSELESPLFEDVHADHEHEHEHEHEHSDIHAHYALTCTTPGALSQLDLAPLFQHFPATRTLHVQLIGPNGQKGQEATATQAKVAF